MAYKPKYPPPDLHGINTQKRKIRGSPNNNFQAQERAHVAGEIPQFDSEIKSAPSPELKAPSFSTELRSPIAHFRHDQSAINALNSTLSRASIPSESGA